MVEKDMRNKLAQASSPYLLQHKDNPVHWQEWSGEVLALAKELDKPILLSVGYSSCHWCHVMAHESFEDEGVAKVMNEHFINIKLDREERPDLDKTYQLAHQLLNRQAGGWPLTTILDPKTLVPFFSGTYFPKKPKFGLPAFTELLQNISRIFKQKRDEITEQNERLTQALQTIATGTRNASEISTESLVPDFANSVLKHHDKRYGGMEGAPKFPQPAIWASSLALSTSQSLTNELADHLRQAVLDTAKGFCNYGLFDHLAGGFFRYCVDERWDIPHFEKMLYDNGQLLSLVAATGHYFADGQLMHSVDLTIQWLKEQMLAPEGGFYSALDADSEDESGKSVEGAYYSWQPKQFTFLEEPEETFAKHYYGLNKKANFEGQWHLVAREDWRQVAKKLKVHEKQAPILLESARQQLKMVREKRPLPFRDDKLLTSWNALTLQGLLEAKRAGSKTASDELINGCKNFIRQQVWKEQQLYACYKNGTAYQEAFLDDYGYLAKGILLALSDRFTQVDWSWLKQICETLWNEFADKAEGGFYFTSNHHQEVITRHKNWSDDAMPSSSIQALESLWVVAELTGNTEWLEFVEKSLLKARAEAASAPVQYASAVRLLEVWQQGIELWVIRGEGYELPQWKEYLTTGLNPSRWVFAIEHGANDTVIETKFPAKPDDEQTLRAYCCRQHQCFPPISDLEKLKSFLQEN
ncbi:thioredoxin domain-containing protein [Kangiella japonica]|uniref:Thioredoxin domain-containing protein n=1 Tax=Kangiella japonica TaxID=647384 RepID=A0ABN0SZ50_9GAMM